MKKTLPLVLLVATTACQQVEIKDVQVAQYQGDKKAAISFTFDDGMLCHYTDIAPALEQNGLRGTFWIIGANMDTDVPDYPWMTWEQVADLARRGHEIGNHSWNHPDLTKISEEQLHWEVNHNDSVIEMVTGQRPKSFCYPYNAMSDTVVAFCSLGRVGTRTFQEAQGQRESHQDAESMTMWLTDLMARGEWGVTMTHGTTYGWDMWDDPQLLYNFFAEAKTYADSLWIAPFGNVAAYLKERENAIVSWTSNGNTIVLTPRVHDLDTELFNEPLTFRIEGNFEGLSISATQNYQTIEVKNLGTHILFDAVPNGEEVILKW